MYKFNFKTNKYEAQKPADDEEDEVSDDGYESDEIQYNSRSMSQLLSGFSAYNRKPKVKIQETVDDESDGFSWLPKLRRANEMSSVPVEKDEPTESDGFSWLPKLRRANKMSSVPVEKDEDKKDGTKRSWLPVSSWWCFRFSRHIYNLCGIYVLWILLHFASVKLYSRYCVPSSFIGLLLTPFLVPTPHCKALRWTMHQGGSTIDSMWIVMGTWLASKIVVMVKKV